MNTENIALLITFLLGIFIGIGAILAFFFQNKKKMLDFIFALALSLLLMLIAFDLLPEIIEIFTMTYIWLFLLLAFVGILLFKVLDEFIPEHQHDKHLTKQENATNMNHIGTLTTIALVIHNIIEGMAIFIAAANDVSLGIMMSLGVGLHNIPLGMIITTTFTQSNTKKSKVGFYIFALCISSFLGGAIAYVFEITNVNPLWMGSLLSLTLGMLSYIVFFELWPRVKATSDKKITTCGLLVGIILLAITMLF